MEIELTEEQRLLRETCREFADRELKPNAKRWDREHKYPAEAVKKAFELGLGGVAVPSEWGGAGMDTVAYALACVGFGFTRPGFTAGASLAVPLAEQGAVAGVITSANGISYVLAPTIGIGLYGLNHDLPFAVFALLLLGLAAVGRSRLEV